MRDTHVPTHLLTHLLTVTIHIRSHRLRAVRAQQVLRRPKVRPWSELEGKYMEQRLSYDYVFKCVVRAYALLHDLERYEHFTLTLGPSPGNLTEVS